MLQEQAHRPPGDRDGRRLSPAVFRQSIPCRLTTLRQKRHHNPQGDPHRPGRPSRCDRFGSSVDRLHSTDCCSAKCGQKMGYQHGPKPTLVLHAPQDNFGLEGCGDGLWQANLRNRNAVYVHFGHFGQRRQTSTVPDFQRDKGWRHSNPGVSNKSESGCCRFMLPEVGMAG